MRILTATACLVALLAATACGRSATTRAATGGLGGAAVGTVVGGPVIGTGAGAITRRDRRRRDRPGVLTTAQCRFGCAPVPSSSSTRPDANRSSLSFAAAACGAPVAIRCAKHQPEAGVALNPP